MLNRIVGDVMAQTAAWLALHPHAQKEDQAAAKGLYKLLPLLASKRQCHLNLRPPGQSQSNQEKFLGTIFTIYAGGQDPAPLRGRCCAGAEFQGAAEPCRHLTCRSHRRGDHADPDAPQLVPPGQRL